MSQGKGDAPRPSSVPRGTVEANYERIFRHKDRYVPPGVRYFDVQLSTSVHGTPTPMHTPPPQAPDDEAREA